MVNGVDVQDHGLDLVALFEQVAGSGDTFVREFGDVNQALDALLEFDENAEIGDAGDFAFDRRAWWVFRWQGAPSHRNPSGVAADALMFCAAVMSAATALYGMHDLEEGGRSRV